jgi:hypothetical protein
MKKYTEEQIDICPYCKFIVKSHWAMEYEYGKIRCRGMISEPQVTLVADWIYHSECWDKLVEEHPP